jgi:hypothetical protein
MNRSYSKIRHIQESNLRLEKRFINEDSLSSLSQLKKTFPNVPKIMLNFYLHHQ